MSLTMNDPTWSPDLTLACERLAERLHATGVTHPVAAAVALTARGHLGLSQSAFAERIGMSAARVAELEAGHVPFADLPDEVSAPLGPGLLRLAALNAELGPPPAL